MKKYKNSKKAKKAGVILAIGAGVAAIGAAIAGAVKKKKDKAA